MENNNFTNSEIRKAIEEIKEQASINPNAERLIGVAMLNFARKYHNTNGGTNHINTSLDIRRR